jgi:hypothetical protein
VPLHFGLQDAARKSNLNWPDEEIDRLQRIDVEAFWEGWGRNEHLRTIIQFLQEQKKSQSLVGSAPVLMSSLSQVSCTDEKLVTERPVPQLSKSFDLDDKSAGTRAVPNFPGMKRLTKYTGFKFFRRLGLFLWDLDRLVALGLANRKLPPERTSVGWIFSYSDDLSKSNIWLTWQSLKSEEELKAYERRRIDQFPDEFRAFESMRKGREYYWYDDRGPNNYDDDEGYNTMDLTPWIPHQRQMLIVKLAINGNQTQFTLAQYIIII